MKTQNRIIKKALTIALTTMFMMGMAYGQEKAGDKTPAQAADSSKVKKDGNPAAQKTRDFCPDEFSIWAAGGASALSGSPTFGERTFGVNGAFGLGYTRYFSKKFGIQLGAEIAKYNAGMNLKNLNDAYESQETWQQDPFNPENRIYHADIRKYVEKQELLSLNIPLLLQFQTPLAGSAHRFYIAAGAKLGIPLKATYKVTEFDGRTWGYYHEGSQQPMYDQADLGYYPEIKGAKAKEKLNMDLAWIGTIETGVKWRLGKKTSLYSGIYLDYGFNNTNKADNNSHFVNFEKYRESSATGANAAQHALDNLNVNSMLTSQYTRNGETQAFTNCIAPIAFGVKLRLSFGICALPEVEKKKGEKRSGDNLKSRRKDRKGAAKTKEENENLIEPIEENYLKTGLLDKNREEDMERVVSEYGISVKEVFNIETEGYDLDQTLLSPRMQQILNEKIARIKATYGTDISIICEGHTCNLGNTSYNLKLGQKRAEVVRKYLISKGYHPSRVTAVSKGQFVPIVPNTSEANRKINRRVVLIIKD